MVILKKRSAIRLELSPATPDAPAVVVTITPIGQANIDVAMARVTSSLVKVEDGASELQRYGVEPGDNTPEALRLALRVGDAMLAIELGIRHITAWEGVGQEDDTPAPVEPALIALLFNEWAPRTATDPLESYASRFMRRINGLSTLEPGAKKGSGASPDIATAAAPSIAPTAARPETPAPPADA